MGEVSVTKKPKRVFIPCPVDSDCRNWDVYNECCQDKGCRASGFKKITREDVPFYVQRNKARIEARNIKNVLTSNVHNNSKETYNGKV